MPFGASPTHPPAPLQRAWGFDVEQPEGGEVRNFVFMTEKKMDRRSS